MIKKALAVHYLSADPQETIAYGSQLAKKLSPKCTVAFFGDLGTGKTTFIKGIVQEICKVHTNEINSPTFSYLNIYKGLELIYHFDLYRIKNEIQFLSMGFCEYISSDGICLIEWAEHITNLLPKDTIRIEMHHKEANTRQIIISKL